MSKTTKAFMRKFRRKLNHVIDEHLSACGHDLSVYKAREKQTDLEEFVEAAIEEAEQGGGK